jgi:hypothetical protein
VEITVLLINAKPADPLVPSPPAPRPATHRLSSFQSSYTIAQSDGLDAHTGDLSVAHEAVLQVEQRGLQSSTVCDNGR